MGKQANVLILATNKDFPAALQAQLCGEAAARETTNLTSKRKSVGDLDLDVTQIPHDYTTENLSATAPTFYKNKKYQNILLLYSAGDEQSLKYATETAKHIMAERTDTDYQLALVADSRSYQTAPESASTHTAATSFLAEHDTVKSFTINTQTSHGIEALRQQLLAAEAKVAQFTEEGGLKQLRTEDVRRRYEKFWHASSTPVANITRVLENYVCKTRFICQDFSATMRFFRGHWNRNHIKAVEVILQKISSNELKTPDAIIAELKGTEQLKGSGSLARRLTFIINKTNESADGDLIDDPNASQPAEQSYFNFCF